MARRVASRLVAGPTGTGPGGTGLGPLARSLSLAADICEQLQRNLTFDLDKADFVGDAKANRLRSRAMRPPYTI